MKAQRVRFFGFLAVLFFLTTSLHAECSCCPKPKTLTLIECEKTYIQPSQIELLDEHIYVQVNNRVVQTAALHADACGIFFKDVYKETNCPDGFWECQTCHACNAGYTFFCTECWN